jgi:NitT/TauT family transport system permease protein
VIARLARSLAAPLFVIAAWEVACRALHVRPGVLPPPTQVVHKLWEYLLPVQPFDGSTSRLAWLVSGELPHDAAATLGRVSVGFAIGAGLALPLGLWMGARETAYQLWNPLVQLVRPIPPIAFIPLAILWFGLGNPPAYFLIALGAFFPVLINTIAGVRGVDSIFVRAALNLGAAPLTLFRRVLLPGAMPSILAGLRVGVGVAFIVVIVAEMIAVNSGLGYRILEAREYFWSDKIIAGMISIGLIGLAIDTGMSRLNAHLLRWHRGLA